MEKYEVFHRTWWKHNAAWPNNREPHPGTRHHIAYVATENDAISLCRAWATNHEPGPLSVKAEWDNIRN